MHFLRTVLPSILLASAQLTAAASSWSFEDASLSIASKGAGVGAGVREKLSPTSPLASPISLGHADTLKILLTTIEGKKAKRPHQAFLTVTEPATGLEESFPLSVKESGKGKVEVTQKDLPIQFLTSGAPLSASLVIASFGSSTPLRSPAFTLNIELDQSAPQPKSTPAVRYGAQPEIHHTFRADPQSPPKIITLVFTAAAIAALPLLAGAWLSIGGNVNHLGMALGAAPVSHALFFGSIVALDGVFFLYYTSWNLFQTLPVAGAIGAVTFLSGSRALSEVQERRLKGLR